MAEGDPKVGPPFFVDSLAIFGKPPKQAMFYCVASEVNSGPCIY